jgi:tetratricopeptide (TPR) repeat protein
MRFRIRNGLLSISVLGAVLFMHSAGSADEIYEKNKNANNLYKLGKYDDALKLYDDALLLAPNDNKLKANKGSTLYKKGDFDKAEEQYKSAITDSLLTRNANTHFNMGNILYRQGEKLQISGDPGKAKEKFQAALEHYIKTLDSKPDDNDAKWNLQLAHARIKQAEQQQQNKDNKNNEPEKEPSENAKKIKAEADRLVSMGEYKNAFGLMQNLLKKDPTAAAYNDYTKRLSNVVSTQ